MRLFAGFDNLRLLRLQSNRAITQQGGKQQLPRRAALGLYTEGLNTAKLLPHYGAQRLFNRTGLTS